MSIVEHVAKAMYETPADGDDRAPQWPPPHPDDRAFWEGNARAAIHAQLTWPGAT